MNFFGIFVMFLVLNVSGAWGQSPFTATYTFTGTTGNVASFAYNGTTYTGITMGAILKVGVTTSSSSSNFRASEWPTGATTGNDVFTGSVDLAKYFGFTIAPVSGYKYTITSISFGVGRSASGSRQCQWRGSKDTYGSMLNNYSNLASGFTNSSGVLTNTDANSSWTGNLLTLGASYSNLTTTEGFRIYLYNSEATSGTGGLQGPITISGTFEPTVSSYTVTYNSNGGTGTMTDVSSPYNSGANVTVMTNTFTRAGYTFDGWATSAGGAVVYANGAPISSIAANVTLYAKWTANNNTITFDGNSSNGGSMSTQDIATDASANLTTNAYTKTGYTFAGWATSAGGAVAYANTASYTMGTGNVILYAKWTANNNTITFNGNGSDGGSMSAQTITTDASANLTTNAFTKTGYSFNGWNTASDGSGTAYTNGVSYSMGTSNVTLYAQWSIVSTPTINVTGSLTAVSTTYGTASSATSFSVSGSALTERILISPPAGFEVSLASGSGYVSTITLGATGEVSSTTIYVRLASTTTPANYSGNVVMSSSGATSQNLATVLSTVSTKQLNISGLAITSTKVYDGSTSAAVTGTPTLLSSIATGLSVSSDGKPITSDDVSLTGTASGVYNSKDVASATTASVAGLSLTGAKSAYYTLNQGSVAATITAKNLTMSGLSVPASKPYDGTTTAVVTDSKTLQTAEAPGSGATDDGKPYTDDAVSITGTATGTYDDANVASATTVTYSGLSLTGAEAGNYTFTIQSPQAATITKASQTITGVNPTATKYVGDANYTFSASSATLGTNALSYSSSDPAVASIDASTGLVQIKIVGSTTITVSQAGNANYNAATNATQTLTVNAAPTLLLTEDFTTAGVITSNGWTAHSTGTNPITSASGSTTYSGYLSSGLGNEITMTTSGEDDNKTFTAQTSGTVYASCLINVTSATTTGDYFFHFGATVISTNYHGKVFVKKDATGNLSFGISKNGAIASAVFTPFNYALNTTYILVLKYTIVAGATNDYAEIYINPTLNATEPVSGWISSTDNTAADLANIGSVALRQGTAANAPALKLDGIRVSTNWTDIVGITRYSITASATGAGSVSGAGTKDAGATVTLTATPDNSTTHRFVNWTEGATIVSTANPYIFTASADKTLVANFDVIAIGIAGGGNINASTFASCATCDMAVTGAGTVLTIDESKEVKDVSIASGSSLKLGSNTLTVKGDLTFSSDNTSSFSANIGTGGIAVTGTVNYVKFMDDVHWYFMAFPVPITVANIKYADSGLPMGANLLIKYYDGANRATGSLGSNWITNVDAVLTAKKGYIFGIVTGSFNVKFPLPNSIVASEGTTDDSRKIPAAANPATNGAAANHRGWNLVGQPFLSKYPYTGTNVGAANMYFPGDATGTTYDLKDNTKGKIIDPFAAYFVQVDDGLGFSFDAAGRVNAPAAVAVASSDRVQLNFTSATGTDETDLVMDNAESTDYKIGSDFEKMIGTGTPRPQIYTSIAGVNYAKNALPMSSVVNLPVGIYTKTAGTTTISAIASLAPGLSYLLLTDTKTQPVTVTDLLKSDYTFTAAAGIDNTRFVITAQRMPTAIDNALDENSGISFISMNGKLLLNNINSKTTIRVYDAIGRQIVNTTTNNSSLEIPLKSSGVFTIQLEYGGKNSTKKIINY